MPTRNFSISLIPLITKLRLFIITMEVTILKRIREKLHAYSLMGMPRYEIVVSKTSSVIILSRSTDCYLFLINCIVCNYVRIGAENNKSKKRVRYNYPVVPAQVIRDLLSVGPAQARGLKRKTKDQLSDTDEKINSSGNPVVP